MSDYSREYCTETDAGAGTTIERGISIGLCAIVQTIIWIHFCLSIHRKKLINTKKYLIIIFMTAHITAVVFHWTEWIRQFIGSTFYPSLFEENELFCNYTSLSNRFYVPLFYTLIFHLLLFRLRGSFALSSYRLSNRMFLTLLIGFDIPISIVTFAYIALTKGPCLSYFAINEKFLYCYDEPLGIRYYCQAVGLLLIIISNIIIASIFASKLYTVTKNLASERLSKEISSLIVKNSIITFWMVISPLVLWIAWILFVWDSCMHFDVLVNTILMSLTFKFNNKYYKLCQPFLACGMKQYIEKTQLMEMTLSRIGSTESAQTKIDSDQSQKSIS